MLQTMPMEMDGSRSRREARRKRAAGSSPALATWRPAWRDSFRAEADRSWTEAPRWPASGFEADQASGYAPVSDETVYGSAARGQSLREFLLLWCVDFEEERRRSVGLNLICASSVHRAHDSCRAPHPPGTECRARASSIPAAAGQWPMPDVGHSYWGCSSSILRRKHSLQADRCP